MTQETKTIVAPLSKSAEELMKEAFETQELIEAGRQHIEQLEGHLANIKKELLDHDIREAGNYELFEKTRITRSINANRFKEVYPDVYTKIKEQEIERATITAGKNILVKDAEYFLGKTNIDPVCDLKVSSTTVVLKKQLD